MNKDDDEKKYGSSGINILWPITSNEDYKTELSNAKDGKSPNNISPIIKYSLNKGVTVLWFGDLENTFMEKLKILLNYQKRILYLHLIMGGVVVKFQRMDGKYRSQNSSNWRSTIGENQLFVWI